MTDAARIEARITQIFSTALHLDIPSVETDLFETGAVDSLGFVELLLHLEREFAVRVSLSDLDLDQFRTIRRIGAFVLSRNGRHGDHGPAHPEEDAAAVQ